MLTMRNYYFPKRYWPVMQSKNVFYEVEIEPFCIILLTGMFKCAESKAQIQKECHAVYMNSL
jgi:hypothetical protein